MYVKKTLVGALMIIAFSCVARELHWDWNKINPDTLSFPSTFLWGCADSALQTEGTESVGGKHVPNSWTVYEPVLDKTGQWVYGSARVGKACERWTRYASDILLLKNLGMNAYRFSIEWSKIEPREGTFDEAAMQHYIDVVDELLAHDIVPIPTLFHHTYPVWFSAKGGFEQETNSRYFVRFVRYVFEHLHTKVRYWITFNEPIGYAIEAYFRGKLPPGKKSFKLAGKVAKNQLDAHVTLARELKKINPQVKIGIAHIYNPLDAYHAWNPLERIVTKVFDYIINDLTIDYFKTGKFNWAYVVRGFNTDAPGTLDFIGLNYYTHTVIKQTGILRLEPKPRPDEIVLDDPTPNVNKAAKSLYPEGLYRGIKQVARLNIPIFITENGTAATDPALAKEYIKKHLYVVSRALKEGYPIKGYLFWTLMDCFCWRKGYHDRYGIYAVDFKTQKRTFRPTYQYLVDIIKKSRGLTHSIRS